MGYTWSVKLRCAVAGGLVALLATACADQRDDASPTGGAPTPTRDTTSTSMITNPSPTEPTVTRGEVITTTLVEELSRAEVQAILDGCCDDSLGDPDYGVAIWRITYKTIDIAGDPTIASGTVVVPDGAAGPRPVVSEQHGTQTLALAADAGAEELAIYVPGLAFAGHGYFVVGADYLGLGDSMGLHPYLDAASEASAAIDMLVAARAAALQLDTELGDQLFLSGYSQGGHVTMALHRELERVDHGFTVTASFPMAGPYASI